MEGTNTTLQPSKTRYLLYVIPALSMRTITLVMTLLINNSYHLTHWFLARDINNFKFQLFVYGTLFFMLHIHTFSVIFARISTKYCSTVFGYNSLINLTFEIINYTNLIILFIHICSRFNL